MFIGNSKDYLFGLKPVFFLHKILGISTYAKWKKIYVRQDSTITVRSDWTSENLGKLRKSQKTGILKLYEFFEFLVTCSVQSEVKKIILGQLRYFNLYVVRLMSHQSDLSLLDISSCRVSETTIVFQWDDETIFFISGYYIQLRISVNCNFSHPNSCREGNDISVC